VAAVVCRPWLIANNRSIAQSGFAFLVNEQELGWLACRGLGVLRRQARL